MVTVSHEVESEVEFVSVLGRVLGGGNHVPFAGELGSVMGRTARDEASMRSNAWTLSLLCASAELVF
jgi:hypothetical protein